MSTKKPTAKQLAARKRFAEMAKNGTLAKKRKAATKKTGSNKKTGLKAPKRTTKRPISVFSNKKLAQDFADKKNKTSRKYIYKVSLFPDENDGDGNAHMVRASLMPGLKIPQSKGLTTLCAKTIGVPGRRKKDGTVKKGHIVTKGGVIKRKIKTVKKK